MASRPTKPDWYRVMIRFRPAHVRQIDEAIQRMEYPSSREDVLRGLILRSLGIADPDEEKRSLASGIRARSA